MLLGGLPWPCTTQPGTTGRPRLCQDQLQVGTVTTQAPLHLGRVAAWRSEVTGEPVHCRMHMTSSSTRAREGLLAPVWLCGWFWLQIQKAKRWSAVCRSLPIHTWMCCQAFRRAIGQCCLSGGGSWAHGRLVASATELVFFLKASNTLGPLTPAHGKKCPLAKALKACRGCIRATRLCNWLGGTRACVYY